MKKPEYRVEKSTNKEFNWVVMADNKIVCYIPTYYKDDRSIALVIKHALEIAPIIPDLDV